MERTESGAGIFSHGDPALLQFHVTNDVAGNPLDWQLWVEEVRPEKKPDGLNCRVEGHRRYKPVYEMCDGKFRRIMDQMRSHNLTPFVCECNGHRVE